jgi:hypothetical protein
MSLFDNDDIDSLIDALGGGVAAVFGTDDLPVIFHGDRQVRLVSDELVTVPPHAVASAARVVALEIAAGDNGDTLTIGGDDYTVLAIDPAAAGTVTLTLEKQ